MLILLSAAAASPLAAYQAKTRVVVGCTRPADSREIIVCGRRAADRWRVPLVEKAPGDPRVESVSGERNRLASEPARPCGSAAILSGCGIAGVSVSSGFGGHGVQFRTLAE